MTSLRQTQDLTRAMTWQGKSIAICSRKELVECVIHLGRQVTAINDENQQLKAIVELVQEKLKEFQTPQETISTPTEEGVPQALYAPGV